MYLGNQAVWHRYARNSGYEGRTAEKKKIPMKTGGFLEWELARLGRETANILLPGQPLPRPLHQGKTYVVIIK
jgi:hypothetical protein